MQMWSLADGRVHHVHLLNNFSMFSMQMWFLADGRVHHVHLVVPHTFYVDSD